LAILDFSESKHTPRNTLVEKNGRCLLKKHNLFCVQGFGLGPLQIRGIIKTFILSKLYEEKLYHITYSKRSSFQIQNELNCLKWKKVTFWANVSSYNWVIHHVRSFVLKQGDSSYYKPVWVCFFSPKKVWKKRFFLLNMSSFPCSFSKHSSN
jgi:hypothetical protein